MDPVTVIIAAVALVAFLVWKQSGLISGEEAQRHLREGARVVDVRSPGEYASDHVSGAINIPLGQLDSEAPSKLTDKDQVILVHCLSGTRSAAAKRILLRMGYANVHNVGGLGRTRRLLKK